MGYLLKFSGAYASGAGVTILLSLLSVVLGFILGLFTSLAKLSNNKLLNTISNTYIEVIRGTPLMVQIVIIGLSVPSILKYPDFFGLGSEFTAGIIALTLNSGAYIAEILRSGIQSINKGQVEASRSLGMNYWQSMRYVIIPQAIKNILPALGNEFITLIKESAIVCYIGITDIMFVAGSVKNSTYKFFGPYLLAAAIYFVITFTLSRVLRIFEKRMSRGLR